jgi:NADH:ubiquinone oxidoreductase subunit E
MIDNDIHQRVKAARVQEILEPYRVRKTSAKKGARK